MSAYEINNEITEAEAVNKIKQISQKDEVYILLSIHKANMISGVSEPYIGQIKNNKILFLFGSYNQAKSYVDTCHYEVLDGIYLIGKLKKKDPFNSINNVLYLALQMGINLVDYNPCSEDAFGFQIDWYIKTNNLESSQIGMMLSKQKMQSLFEQNNKGIIPNFNPINIENFNSSYNIDSKRAEIILRHVFYGGETTNEMYMNFLQQETLHENCFVSDYINTKMIPLARQDNKDSDIEYFKQINKIIEMVVWDRLNEESIFTLVEKQTGQIYINNGFIYAIYTDLFKYMGRFDYKKLSGKSELKKIALENNIRQIIVTDGPHGMTIIEEDIFNS